MKSYRTLALKELLSQKVTSILILIAVVLSTMMTTIVGQSIGVLSAMREQQAIAIGGNRYATFLQMNADQLHALEQDERLSYVGKSIYMGSLELSPSLTLGLMEYWDDTAAIYPSSTSVEEGRLPEAPMEIRGIKIRDRTFYKILQRETDKRKVGMDESCSIQA